ncbi:HAD-superfamily subfamily IB hydrolase, TIGR01490 [Candidatus Electrothrix aarhusensis]|jgi:HAD superfamily hydrolase (TIGR01490 family)|uniref:HAD-superfamily subfamily IB hydrolase, TIGR01490 n=1 Tax=Candidatus Electrothrix aarhusensis TaxID=1859131 RepID=A0A444IQV6_9BACT|nr:HAD-superfamily subfamily IB hydrolase, TIGR01490 [Candidatus Electrothrix aarhusensis]
MALSLFDLDNTLLAGDSDYEWGRFLVKKGLVDEASYEAENNRFFDQYKQGTLDIYEFCAFSFQPLAERNMEELQQLHAEFMRDVIQPMIGGQALALVNKHKEHGDTMMVITATNSFITGPIVRAFGIEHLLATEPKIVNNRYTTEIDGIPCFHEGKVQRLENWLAKNKMSLQGSCFYSDSINDLPLLEKVDTPVAVDPDEKLATLARQKGWDCISLRD